MEKKHVSIIGSCVSRELFNTSLLREYAEVDTYIFQRCPWDMAPKGEANYQKQIMSLNYENFWLRTICYSFDKTAIKELRASASEYLLIDVYNMRANVFKAILNGVSYYFQSTTPHDALIVKKMKEERCFANIEIVPLNTPLEELPVKEGLKYLAKELKEIYDEEKIIINIPKNAEQYYFNGKKGEYSEEKLKISHSENERVLKWSKFLHKLLPSAKVLNEETNPVAMFGEYDDIKTYSSVPPAIHHSRIDNVKKGLRFLELMGISLQGKESKYLSDQLFMEMDKYIRVLSELKKFKRQQITLNNYFDQIENKNNVIIIITAKDDASNKFKYFRNRKQLPLKFYLGFRDSYIAVVDLGQNFVYEKVSTEKLSFSYKADGHTIDIESAGYCKGNISKVTIDNGPNISKNVRGLNIVVLDAKECRVIDSSHCDTFGDAELLIQSDFYNNIKIK